MIVHPYGYRATSSLRSRKISQYPPHDTSRRTARYKKDITNNEAVCDCIGGAKGYARSGGSQSMLDTIGTSKYSANGCPDKGASSMFSYAKSKGCAWGAIFTPLVWRCARMAMRTITSATVELSGGRALPCGCVKTQVSKRPRTHWHQLPFIDYGNGVITGDGRRSLSQNCKAADVKALQEFLLQLGFKLPKYGSDGGYGT